MRTLKADRGSVLLVMGLTIPVLLLFAAISIEVGTWYVHKRSLQNRADAAAYAAAAAYATRFPACAENPAGDALEAEITDEARRFAGATAGDFNTGVNNQSKIEVTINKGGDDPCRDHPPLSDPPPPDADEYDRITPDGGYWTHVKVKETDVGGLVMGMIGVGAQPIAAEARAELRQLETATGMRPFVLATSASCVEAAYSAVGGPVLALQNVSGVWSETQPRSFNGPDTESEVDLKVGYGDCDPIYGGMAWITRIYAGSTGGENRLTGLSLTPTGTCTNAYFIPYDGQPCTITVTAAVGFSGADEPVRLRTGIDPSDQGIAMSGTGSGPYTAQITVDPLDGALHPDGLYEIEVIAGPPDAAVPVGRAKVQAGTAIQQGPIADVELDNYTALPGTPLGEINVRLRSTTLGTLLPISAGVDCDPKNSGDPTTKIKGQFSTPAGCIGPFGIHSGGPCDPDAALITCVNGVGGGRLNDLANGNPSEYDARWAPNDTCSPRNPSASTTTPQIAEGDPRLITVFLTDQVPSPRSASQRYPITGFASFYVTGWQGAPTECDNETAPPGTPNSGGWVWGRYLRFVATSGTGTPGPDKCSLSGSEACVATLVR